MKRSGLFPILSVLSAGLLSGGLLLVACKGAPDLPESAAPVSTSPANPPPIPARPTPGAIDARPLLLCFGDSLTAGYGTEAGESYPDQLQKLLDAESLHYRVVNAGISGDTTKDGVDRLPRLAARHAAIAVVEFGGNDGLRGLPLEQTQANLAQIIQTLQASGTSVALAGITLPPDYGPTYIARFNAMYTQLARRFHVRLLPFLLQGVYGVPGSMQADATHATAKGNVQVARNVAALVKPLLKS